PYFLYAASNAGSLVGLLAYPFLIERCLTLPHQQWVFAGGVFLYSGMVLCCALTIIRRRPNAEASPTAEIKQKEHLGSQLPLNPDTSSTDRSRTPIEAKLPETNGNGNGNGDFHPVDHIPAKRIARWVALAALPSSLLLGVTTHVSTDLAPVPLLWVVPLALYLLSFILVFARWPDGLHRAVGRVTPILILFVVLSLLMNAAEPFGLIAASHM